MLQRTCNDACVSFYGELDESEERSSEKTIFVPLCPEILMTNNLDIKWILKLKCTNSTFLLKQFYEKVFSSSKCMT